jgi:hypothetical protein
MNEKKLFKLISILILIILGVIIYLIVAQPARKVAAPPSGSTTISGEIACLPKHGDGLHTLECALGIKSSDKYYALKNLDTHDPNHKFSATGQKVKVAGSLKEGGDKTYDIAGTIDITTIEKSN